MTRLLLDIKAEVHATPDNTLTLPPQRIAHYPQRYEEVLQTGLAETPRSPALVSQKRGRKKQSPPRNLVDGLDKYRSATVAFMSNFRVPFDNNLAERDVRMMKVKQKLSGAFGTAWGAETFCALRSDISTVRKQGIPVIQAICDALLGQPFFPATYTYPE